MRREGRTARRRSREGQMSPWPGGHLQQLRNRRWSLCEADASPQLKHTAPRSHDGSERELRAAAPTNTSSSSAAPTHHSSSGLAGYCAGLRVAASTLQLMFCISSTSGSSSRSAERATMEREQATIETVRDRDAASGSAGRHACKPCGAAQRTQHASWRPDPNHAATCRAAASSNAGHPPPWLLRR